MTVATRPDPAILHTFYDSSGRVCYRFTLPGAPRTKKTSNRVLRMGTRNLVLPSKAWLAWRDLVRDYVATKPALQLGLERPVNCAAVFYRDAERGDCAGYITGLADVLQECGIVVDDKHITQWDGTRLQKNAACSHTVVTLTVLGAE